MLTNFKPYNFPLHGLIRLPEIKILEDELLAMGLSKEASNFDFLKALAREKFDQRIDKTLRKEYIDRAKYELDIINELGFTDYYLLVWRVINFCDKNQIPRGGGRGSCAGSLVLYLMSLTDCDSIKYGLYFERFISKIRAKSKIIDGITYIDGANAPDIDLDISPTRRYEVLNYLHTLFPNRICKVSTRSRLSSKSLIKECTKIILNYSEDEAKHVSDLIPKNFGIVSELDEARKEDKKFDKWCSENEETFLIASGIALLNRGIGVHASGHIIANEDIDRGLPTQWCKSEEKEGGDVACSLTGEFVCEKYIKLDLLGLKCCDIIYDVMLATGTKKEDINFHDDPIVYDTFQNLRAERGIFQIEGAGNKISCQKIAPKNLEELSDSLGICRPGAHAWLDKYVKNDGEPIHSFFGDTFKLTRHIVLYQEQLMRAGVQLGLTLDEAEIVRKLVGKKQVEKVKPWEEKLNTLGKKNNIPQEVIDIYFHILNDSAKYSFNKSHSISYAAISATCLWLKERFPIQFFKALLNQAKNCQKPLEEISKIAKELPLYNLRLLGPDLTRHNMEFAIEDGNIRFGLQSIKGIGDKKIDALKLFKPENANRFQMFAAAEQAELNVAAVCALIYSGCLDTLIGPKTTRNSLALQCQLWNLLKEKERAKAMELGEKHNFNLFAVFTEIRTLNNEKGKPIITDKRYETIMKSYSPKKEIYEINKKYPQLTEAFFEKLLIGYTPTGKIYEYFSTQYDKAMPICEVNEATDKQYVSFFGMIETKPVEKTSKNKNRYLKYTVFDETGAIDIMMFNQKDHDKIAALARACGGKVPQIHRFIFVKGQKSGDIVFAESITDQDISIALKYSEAFKKQEEEKEIIPDEVL